MNKATFLLCGVKQRLVEYPFFLWDLRFVSSCFAWILFLVEFLWRFTWILKPSSWRTVNPEPWVDPFFFFVRHFALYVTFCSVWCYLAILWSFTTTKKKSVFCSNMLTKGTRWIPFPSFSSLCILSCRRDCSFCFFTFPGEIFSEHSKNVLHCHYYFASHFSSHLTITLRVDVWLCSVFVGVNLICTMN